MNPPAPVTSTSSFLSMGGVCAEVGCLAAERWLDYLKAPVRRIGLPDVPTPAGFTLEQFYYPDVERISGAIRDLVRARSTVSVPCFRPQEVRRR